MTDALSSTSALSSLTSSSATGGLSSTNAAASRDQFLRLFVAQLENQNPLDPQSGADMVAQLAQFSSLEQAVESNNRLADMVSAQDAAASAQLADLVGREVTADASTIQLDGGAPPALQVDSDAQIAGGELTIKDAAGNVVRTIPFGPGEAPLKLDWDGTDANGVPLASGSYAVEVKAHKADGTDITARPQLRGIVDAVELTPSGPRLLLGHTRVSPGAVTTISRPQGV
jgi:flagellar basal-body rod modification protein FlgD